MSKMLLPSRFQTLLVTMMLLVSFSSWVIGDDRFALVVGAHDNLVIFGPKGERIAEMAIPTISQPVTIGTTSFQVSYGRDANDLLTAILAPSSSEPQDLHFNVLNKSIDADKGAVVTLTFHGSKSVTVDPGYIGSVVVNSQNLRQHSMAEESHVSHVSRPVASLSPVPRTSADIEPRAPAPSIPHEQPPSISPAAKPSVSHESASPVPPESSSSIPSTSLPATTSTYSTEAPPSVEPPPLVGGLTAQPPPPYSLNTSSTASSTSPTKEKLYWSEPVTPPNGAPPSVALNQMKLIEVHGPVSVRMSNGETEAGENGMIIPSGSIVTTQDNASAAIFMGGVNSARLMPQCELKVTQNLNGTVRKTTLDLEHGAVFSRIGRRPGETQDYQVRTPEGVAAARGTEMLTFRGNAADLKSPKTTLNSGMTWGWNRLLAWNPTSLGHGQVSDVANPMLATAATSNNFFYVFVAKGTVECLVNGQLFTMVSGQGANVGVTVMPPSSDANKVLQAILEILQPFNVKLNSIINSINNGTAGAGDIGFYNNLIVIYLENGLPTIVENFEDFLNPFTILPNSNTNFQPFFTPETSRF